MVAARPDACADFAQATLDVCRQVEQLRADMSRLYRQHRHAIVDLDTLSGLIAETARRADHAFALTGIIDGLLARNAKHRDDSRRSIWQHALLDARRRVIRYNRQHVACLQSGRIAFAPLRCFRNFLRDQREHMYFVALHDLPTAFDLYCCTYVETPAGYQQEIHLHRESEELTLVVEGTSECVWYEPTRAGELREAGRVTANAWEAFRIPRGVPHRIDSRFGPNRNLTVKLSMFIEDRVGEREPYFADVPKSVQPVIIDPGRIEPTRLGERRTYEHGHGSLPFTYVVDHWLRGRDLTSICSPMSPGHHFLLDGAVRLLPLDLPAAHQGIDLTPGIENLPQSSRSVLTCDSRGVARIGHGHPFLCQLDSAHAHWFHVAGLNPSQLLGGSALIAEFPGWLVDELAQDLARLEPLMGLGTLYA